MSGTLLALQKLELGAASAESGQRIKALRKKVPESLLSQFDRALARGRKAVAVVLNGVCSECHVGIAIGIRGALTLGEELQRCGNCGRFLYLPEDQPMPSAPPAPPTKSAPRRQKGPRPASSRAARRGTGSFTT